MYNPYQPYQNQPYQNFQQPMQQTYQAPHYDIIEVSGRPGAETFPMGPNSRTVLVDNTADRVWFARTDGAGYKTVKPYKVIPEEDEQQTDMKSLVDRVSRLEARLDEHHAERSIEEKHPDAE